MVLLAVLAGTATFFALFYVPNENIEVLGNTRYPNSEIRKLAMPGFLDRNALYLRLFRKTIHTEDVPFIDSIDVEYMGRDRVRLHVNEDYPVGYLLQDGYKMYFDSVGLVIEAIDAGDEAEEETASSSSAAEETGATTEEATTSETEETPSTLSESEEDTTSVSESEEDATSVSETEKVEATALEAEKAGSSATDTEEAAQDTTAAQDVGSAFRPALTDVARVTGLTDARVVPGEIIQTEDNNIFQTLLVLNKLISKLEIVPDEIIIGEGQALSLRYEKVIVALGGEEYLEEKISRAAAILPQLKDMDGTLHLERYTNDTINIIFEQTQKEEPVEVTGTTDLVGAEAETEMTDGEEDIPEETAEDAGEWAPADTGEWVEENQEYAGEEAVENWDTVESETWEEEASETGVNDAESGA